MQYHSQKIKLSYSVNIVIVNFQLRVYNPFINGVIQHVLCFTIFRDNLLALSQSQILDNSSLMTSTVMVSVILQNKVVSSAYISMSKMLLAFGKSLI